MIIKDRLILYCHKNSNFYQGSHPFYNKYYTSSNNYMCINTEDSSYQIGGIIRHKGDGFFKSTYKVYFIADTTDKTLINNYFARLHKLKISNSEMKNIRPHITLTEIQVNRDNPDHKFIVDAYGQINSTLRDLLVQKYEQLSPQMYLKSKKGSYDIMGDFLAKVYRSNNPHYITQFRMILYRYLEMMIGKSKRKIKVQDNKKFFVYSYDGKDLIAVPEYYHGKGIWTPHLSLIKLDKLQRSNIILYRSYQKHGILALIYALRGTSGSIDNLNMSYHLGSLRISVIRS